MFEIHFLSLVLVLMNIKTGLLISQHPKLLVVSYDAFRYDYFNRNITPFMSELKKEGTHTDYMMNIFVTKTFPNHHTMATGLYAETHGVVANTIYDHKTGNVISFSPELYHYDNRILPIWTINEKQGKGRHSGTMMWPGGTFEYQGIVPKFNQTYNDTISWEDRVDTLISWFIHPTNPINFGMLYIEEPDFHGHAIGINSPEFNDILKKLDNLTRYLHDKLEHFGLDDVNVIHLSDHGMTSVTLERIINLTNYINDTDYVYVGSSPALHIFPKPDKEDLIYNRLQSAAKETKKFSVYKREDIPKKYHYGNNTRVGPIFVIAELGYAFQNLLQAIDSYKDKFNLTINNSSEFGLHGYDNEAVEMHPFFFAKGPAFIPGCELEPFSNTDLFPLFCKILDLDCPPVNGTLTCVTKCLQIPSKDVSISSYQIIFAAVASAAAIVGIIISLTIFSIRRRGLATKGYRRSYMDG